MSRKQRERKMQKVEQVVAEKAVILERRKDRLAPVYKMLRKFTIALFFTILILYVGFVINGRLIPHS